VESTSSSAIESARDETMTRTTVSGRQLTSANSSVDADGQHLSQTAQMILAWTRDRRLQRLRPDRRTGLPEKEHLDQWSEILNGMGIADESQVFGLMDQARAAADRATDWRNWSFLTLQIQLAAERMLVSSPLFTDKSSTRQIHADEDPTCEWAKAKVKIRAQVGEIPFRNWFEGTRQIGRSGSAITIEVPDEATRLYVEEEYRELIRRAVTEMSIDTVAFVVAEA
jgi:hypothetical protein